jgi:acetyltransferase EpsM
VSASPLVIIGAGEHARVIADCARTQPERWTLAGYCNATPVDEMTRRFGLPWLGDDDTTRANAPSGACYVLGLGGLAPSPRREELVNRWAAYGVRWATVLHARAIVSDSAAVADGAVVFAGAIINTGASIGGHAVVNTGAIIEHDVSIGAFAMIAPGAALGGGVTVGDGAFVGLGSRVRDHRRVGARALVGMGAVVTADVPDDAVVVGVPARLRRP